MSYSELYQHIHDHPECLGITHHISSNTASDINICTLNVNSLSNSKLHCVLAYMFHMKIDVFVLTDTRHRESMVKSYSRQIKDLLGPSTRCIHSPISPHRTKKGFQSSVGGQLIIISHTWAGALIDHFNDPSNLGLVSGIKLATGGGSLLIMGNYWPFPSNYDKDKEQQGLWAMAAQFLDRKKIKKNPKEYIQNYITTQADRHVAKSSANIAIVCGDFNHRWDNGKYQLQQWAITNNWECPSISHSASSHIPIFTYTVKGKDCSWIDHHLIAPASSAQQVVSTTSSDGSYWDDVSDHRPIMIHLSVSGGRGTAGLVRNPHPRIYHPTPRPSVDLADKKRVKLYQDSLDQYSRFADKPSSTKHAFNNLLNFSCHSAEISNQIFPHHDIHSTSKRSSYKDGWSPTAIALKYQRIAILDILGHYQGTRRRARWKTVFEQSLGIKQIVDTWTKSVLKLKWKPPNNAWDIMNSTPYGPSYWTTLQEMGKASLCIKILEDLKSKLHGKQRQILRENINKAVKLRERMIKEGKLARYNKAVLRESEDRQTLSSITLDSGETLEDPLEVHTAHTEHYTKAFLTPAIHRDGIHHKDWDWKTGGTKDDFIAR